MTNIVGSSKGSEPAYSAAPITRSDTVNIGFPVRGIYVGVSGDVVLRLVDNTNVTFKNAPAGYIIPIRAIRVLLTGTTATDLVGIW